MGTKCAIHNRELTLLFTSARCDECDGLIEKPKVRTVKCAMGEGRHVAFIPSDVTVVRLMELLQERNPKDRIICVRADIGDQVIDEFEPLVNSDILVARISFNAPKWEYGRPRGYYRGTLIK